ncbi:MAG: clostripain-related cysteine peptidase [Lachnospiraceae bacterium]
MNKSRKGLIIGIAVGGGLLLILCVFLSLVLIDEKRFRGELEHLGVIEETASDAAKENINEDKNSSEDEDVLTNNNPANFSMIREPLSTPVGNGEDTVTIMLYFNGSNLESNYGCATDDIQEIIDAQHSDKVNIVLQTMGTRQWQNFDIASDHAQRFLIDGDGLTLVDDTLTQVDCTTAETLAKFIHWSAENYPADRYMLVMWNHGGGPVDGFGYNEFGNVRDSLTIDEIQYALDRADVNFDFIGMDACIMSSLEFCYAVYDHADYSILSEDFESGLGWYYTNWISAISENTSISMEELGKIIVDDMVQDNIDDRFGDSATLALIDERYIPDLYRNWKAFAYENEAELIAMNFSMEVERSSRAKVAPDKVALEAKNPNWPIKVSDLQDYYITDMMAVASSIPSTNSKALARAIKNCIAYYNCTEDDNGLTGLTVTLPYNDAYFYERLKDVFYHCGFDKPYLVWLERFTDAQNADYYDYEEFQNSWSGWDSYTEG